MIRQKRREGVLNAALSTRLLDDTTIFTESWQKNLCDANADARSVCGSYTFCYSSEGLADKLLFRPRHTDTTSEAATV